MGYSRRTSNYQERILLFDPTHLMSMNDLLAINLKILSKDSGGSLEKKFTKLICINP